MEARPLRHAYFNPPALAGRDRAGVGRAPLRLISIHPPLRGGTLSARVEKPVEIFQSTRPCGAGLPLRQQPWGILRFQSTRPLRGGTCGVRGAGWLPGHFNPPAPCGAGPRTTAYQITQIYFNPPAPCGAGPERWPWCRRCRDFNPPAPCGAGPSRPLCSHPASQFQSTRPLRGGTAHCACQRFAVTDFNPPALDMGAAGRSNFNPPAPCGAGQFFWGLLGTALQFQSTRPVLLSMTHATFQSTRPLRGGTSTSVYLAYKAEFQSTRPLRGGTARDFVLMQTDAFQSTRPLRGGTAGATHGAAAARFQSTRPLRGGTRSAKDWRDYTRFQSTRPLRGGTSSN